MRILVTGATGFVGSHIVRRFLEDGHGVTAFHRPSSSLAALPERNVNLAPGDLTDFDSLRKAMAGHDAVVHAAADIRYWSADAALQRRVNVEGTRNVARACRQQAVQRLVYVSSVAAIGIPEDAAHPATEEFAFNLNGAPLHYHQTKKLAEEAIAEEVAGGLDAVIVNPASGFGPHGRHYRGGEMVAKPARGKWVPYFAGGLCAVHVADVAAGVASALERGIAGERYILGGENISFQEIARRALAALHLRKPLVAVPPVVTRVLSLAQEAAANWTGRRPRFSAATHFCSQRYQYYSSGKAVSQLGFRPRNFDAILLESLHYMGTQGATNAK